MTHEPYKNISGNIWCHEDVAAIYFDRKPPEWIADDLVRIKDFYYNLGKQEIKNNWNNFLESMKPEKEHNNDD